MNKPDRVVIDLAAMPNLGNRMEERINNLNSEALVPYKSMAEYVIELIERDLQ